MLWFDYLLLLMPALALSTWAQVRIIRAYASASRITAGRGLGGAEAAELVMRAGGVTDVGIEPAAGELSDYYDARGKVLRLSREVHAGRSMAAVAVAAHEAGHAIQHASGYPGLVLRNAVVPLAGLGSQVIWMLIAAGLLIGMFRLIVAAIVLFWLVLILQLLDLPVELDASRRARRLLLSSGLVAAEGEPAVARMLDAAAWAHVAATLTGGRNLRAGFARFVAPGRGGNES